MAASGCLRTPPPLKIGRGKAARADTRQWMTLEVVELDPPEVVPVRTEAREMAAPSLVRRKCLEGRPPLLEEVSGPIDDHEEGRQGGDRRGDQGRDQACPD